MTTLILISIHISMMTMAQAEAEEKWFVAAIPENFPPHYLLDENGKPTGYAIDTMARLADSAGIKIRYLVKPDWHSTMEALRQQEADLIPNLGITPERSLHFDFTAPVETFALGLFLRNSNTAIHSIGDLEGKTVALVRHNAAVKWLKSYPRIKSRLFEQQEQALFALLSGEVEAMIYPITVTWQMASAIGVDERIRQAELPLFEIKRAVAVKKDNQTLLRRLDQAVNQYKNSEYYQQTYARWHATPKPFWNPQRIFQYGAGIVALLLTITIIVMLWWRYCSVSHLRQQLSASLSRQEQNEAEIQRLKKQLESAKLKPRGNSDPSPT